MSSTCVIDLESTLTSEQFQPWASSFKADKEEQPCYSSVRGTLRRSERGQAVRQDVLGRFKTVFGGSSGHDKDGGEFWKLEENERSSVCW